MKRLNALFCIFVERSHTNEVVAICLYCIIERFVLVYCITKWLKQNLSLLLVNFQNCDNVIKYLRIIGASFLLNFVGVLLYRVLLI